MDYDDASLDNLIREFGRLQFEAGIVHQYIRHRLRLEAILNDPKENGTAERVEAARVMADGAMPRKATAKGASFLTTVDILKERNGLPCKVDDLYDEALRRGLKVNRRTFEQAIGYACRTNKLVRASFGTVMLPEEDGNK